METDHGFVPDDLVFLVDFMNSTYPGTTDHLGSRELLAAWLAEHGRPASVTADQLDTARALRDGLRAAAVRNAGISARDAAVTRAESALARSPVSVSLLDGASPLQARGSGTDAVLGEIAAALGVARLTGRWPRVKACIGGECGFVFWDDSRNASRRWCDMQRCGSRQKMRAYRARTSARHSGRVGASGNGRHGERRTT